MSWEKAGGVGNVRKAIVGLGKFLVATGKSRQRFWSCVMTGVPCVVTWFSSCRQFLGRDIVFSCCDSALFLCHDDVAIEVPMS